MNILLLGGFLGSGKTSVLIPLCRRFVGEGASGTKIAILENEAGEVGVDNLSLESRGLEVRSVFSGCICCTLSTELIPAIKELQDRYDPRWIVLEATGLAFPDRIAAQIREYLPDADVLTLVIADAGRIEELYELMEPLIRGQLRAADILLLNKADLVSEEQLGELKAFLREQNPTADILTGSADREIGFVDEIAERMEAKG